MLHELEESNGPRELNDEELAFVKWRMSDLLDYHELKKEQYKKHRTGVASPLLQEWKRLRGYVLFTENLRKYKKQRHASQSMNLDPVSDESSEEEIPQVNKTAKKNGKRGRPPNPKKAQRNKKILEFNLNQSAKSVVEKLRNDYPDINEAIVRTERSRKKRNAQKSGKKPVNPN